MKDEKSTEDEYSILNLHKIKNETALEWKSFDKNKINDRKEELINEKSLKETLIEINKENEKKIKLGKFEDENISYQRLKRSKKSENEDKINIVFEKSKINVFQKPSDSFNIEAIELSDIQDSSVINFGGINSNSLDIKEEKNCNSKKDIKTTITEKQFNNFEHKPVQEISNIKNNTQNNNNIDPKITNILKERLSNILTPKPTVKQKYKSFDKTKIENTIVKENDASTFVDKINPFKDSVFIQPKAISENPTITFIDRSTLDIIKIKLNDEINKHHPQPKQAVVNDTQTKIDCLIGHLKDKIENELRLKKEIIDLESIIRLQNLEIENLKRRELPKNNSKILIQEGKSAIQKLKVKFDEMDINHQKELSLEKNKNILLSKEVINLKLMIDELLSKLKKN